MFPTRGSVAEDGGVDGEDVKATASLGVGISLMCEYAHFHGRRILWMSVRAIPLDHGHVTFGC